MARDNTVCELNNDGVTGTKDYDDIGIETSSPLGMRGYMTNLFISDVDYDNLCCRV